MDISLLSNNYTMYVYIHVVYIHMCTLYILHSGKEALTHHGHFSSSGTRGGVKGCPSRSSLPCLSRAYIVVIQLHFTIYLVFAAGFGHVC